MPFANTREAIMRAGTTASNNKKFTAGTIAASVLVTIAVVGIGYWIYTAYQTDDDEVSDGEE
jgi:membrane protein DedA with SNARE-associated domain